MQSCKWFEQGRGGSWFQNHNRNGRISDSRLDPATDNHLQFLSGWTVRMGYSLYLVWWLLNVSLHSVTFQEVLSGLWDSLISKWDKITYENRTQMPDQSPVEHLAQESLYCCAFSAYQVNCIFRLHAEGGIGLSLARCYSLYFSVVMRR